MRDTRPIHGPWRIYTREEEEAQIRESLHNKSEYYRLYYERRANGAKPL